MKPTIRFALPTLVAFALLTAPGMASPSSTHLHGPVSTPRPTPGTGSLDTTQPVLTAAHYRAMSPRPDAPDVAELSEADGESQLLQSLQTFKAVDGGSDNQKQFMDQVQSTHNLFRQSRMVAGTPKERLTGGNMMSGKDYLEFWGGNAGPNASLTRVLIGFAQEDVANGVINAHFNSLSKGKLYVLDVAVGDASAPFWVYVGVGSASTDTTMPATAGHILIPVSVSEDGEVLVQLRGQSVWELQSITVDPVQ